MIPDDVAVVGYDNTDLWLALDPTLTTVDYRAAEVQGADVVSVTEGNTDRRVSASGWSPCVVLNLACKYARCTRTGRSPAWPR